MPDIVLLSKIYYQKSSFQEVANSLHVSYEALNIRLIDLLTYLTGESKESVIQTVHHYQSGDNRKILESFARVHDSIVSEYNSYDPRPVEKLSYLLSQKDFVTDKEVAELSQTKFRSTVSSTSVGTWAYYDKGIAIFYAWNKEKLTEGQAYQKAKDIYYLS